MATEAQIAANQQNAQKSTGPITEEGKAVVSQNHMSHGMTGRFRILGWEDAEQFQQLVHSIYDEQKPTSDSERRLVESMIQHFWLMQRAITLQDQCLESLETPDEKRLGLFLRYQTTHERAYYKAMRELQNLRKEKRKEEIGFESQKRKKADEARKQELHEARVRLANARASSLEIDSDIRQTIEAPLPGNVRIPFEDLRLMFRAAAYQVNEQLAKKAA